MDTRAGADTPEAAVGRLETAQKFEASGDLDPVVSGMIPRLFAPGTFIARPALVTSSRSDDEAKHCPECGCDFARPGCPA